MRAQLIMSQLGENVTWVESTANIEIEEVAVIVPHAYRITMQRFGGNILRLQGFGVDVDTSTASAEEVEAAMATQGIHVTRDSSSGNFEIGFGTTGDAITISFDQTVLHGQIWEYFEFV